MKKILVVDNHPVVLKFMSNLLEKAGHKVKTAKDGLSALEILKTNTPDVIFADLVMPNISGEKLCRIVRCLPRLKGIYIVILSAIVAEDKVPYTAYGADTYIEKRPFNEMAQQVLTAIDQSGQTVLPPEKKGPIGQDEIIEREIIKELLASERHYNITLENMFEGILELTTELKIVYVNPAAVSIVGMPEEKLLSRNFTELFHASDHTKIEKGYQDIQARQSVVELDSPLEINERLVSLKMIPIKEEGHNPLLIILRDVTEQIASERRLRESEERYRTLYKNTPVMLHAIDRQGLLLTVSDTWLERLGYSEAEVIGRPSTDFLTEESKIYAKMVILPEFFERGYVKDISYQFKKKNGEVIDVLLSAETEKDENGNIKRSQAVLIDVTRQKKAEEEREKLIKELKKALDEIKSLRGILPLCSFCNKVRNDQGYWEQVDVYIQKYSEADVSHSVCPECAEKHYAEHLN
jgi:PAS domain S-box-containing protein